MRNVIVYCLLTLGSYALFANSADYRDNEKIQETTHDPYSSNTHNLHSSLEEQKECDPVYQVTAEQLNVRTGPNSSSDIIKKLHKGEELCVINTAEGWSQFDGGWVSANYISPLVKDTNNVDDSKIEMIFYLSVLVVLILIASSFYSLRIKKDDMQTNIDVKVHDFLNAIKAAFLTALYIPLIVLGTPIGILFLFAFLGISTDFAIQVVLGSAGILTIVGILSFIVLPIMAFVINYTPIVVRNGYLYIPATDQIRTFTDLIIINPITGLFRRRKYLVVDIQSVANGYTRPGPAGKNDNRKWNVVISGITNGHSFSQRIDVSNKQVRDEVRNILKQVISGKVSGEFSY